jgi:hypothetical protein
MNLRAWAILGCLGILAGCATTWDVDRFEAADADLAGRRSFAWKGGEVGTPTGVSSGIARETDVHVRQAIVTELVRKGYVEVPDAKAADMLVSYQITGSQRFETEKDQRIGAPSPNEVLTPGNAPLPPASLPPREVSIREGSVIMFVEDSASGQLVWRGLITTETRVSSRESALHLAADMARRIAQDFPNRRAAP